METKGRIVLIGDSKVGKTSIASNYQKQAFEEHPSTIGSALYQFSREINNKTVSIELCDTAGQEKYRSLGPIYYRNAVGALAVFDLTNKTSFDSLQKWIETFKESTEDESFVFIVCNKCDLKDQWEVSIDEIITFSQSLNSQLFYTSALTGEGIEDLFTSMFNEVDQMCSGKQKILVPVSKQKSKGCC